MRSDSGTLTTARTRENWVGWSRFIWEFKKITV